MVDRYSGLGALAVSAALLAGCGGGGSAASGAAPSAVADSAAVAASDVGASAFSLPQSYTRLRSFTFGSASDLGYEPVGESRGRLFDLKGDFMATEESPVTLPRAVLVGGGLAVQAPSGAAGVTPNGIAVGSWFDPDIEANRGFVHFQSTGQTQFLPANTRAEFVSETGLVGGHVCTPDGSDCHAFHWSPSSQALAEHPHFGAVWMNNAGTMVGHYQPAEGTSRLATVDAGGAVTPLPSVDAGPGLSAVVQYIADDGTVFLNTGNATTGAQGDAVVIANGAVTRVGRGIAPRPDICGICDCSESTGFRAFSATGHAVGVDTLQYSDKDGVHVAAEVGFHWSARDGATVLRVGASDAIPTSVNAQGVVVGAISAENKPFIWQKDVGGFRLPFEGEVTGIGDAGHLLAHSFDPGHASGHTITVYAPNPAASTPGG